MKTGVNEFLKLVNDIAVLHFNGRKFDDSIVNRSKPVVQYQRQRTLHPLKDMFAL